MHYYLKLKLNKLDSNQYQNFTDPEIDEFLNEAQWIYIKRKWGINNTYKLGFEGSSKRIKDLQSLVVDGFDDPLIPEKVRNGEYKVDLNTLQDKSYFFIRGVAKCTKDSCKDQISLYEVQHDDINGVILSGGDSNNSPSFYWRFLPVVFKRNNSLHLYTADDFNIESICIDYIKQPIQIRIGTYGGFSQQDCEIGTAPEYPEHYEILDIAEMLMKMSIEHPGLQISQIKSQINE